MTPPEPEPVVQNASLAAPPLVSPASGTRFNAFPRQTVLAWQAVPGAARYRIDIEFKTHRKWLSLAGWGSHPKEPPVVSGTQYSFDFVGAQPGRWRVVPIDAHGLTGQPSPWWDFTYLI